MEALRASNEEKPPVKSFLLNNEFSFLHLEPEDPEVCVCVCME